MATLAPMQPGLRSFISYDRVPHGMAAYPVTNNHNAPHLRTGDFVVVDPTDHAPMEGELFLMGVSGSPAPRIVETFHMSTIPGWCVGATAAPNLLVMAGMPAERAGRWCDFPYRTEVLETLLLGRVVGVLEPGFVEPALVCFES